jgi:hypothetical protein
MLEMKLLGGDHISDVCQKACELARVEPVRFEFNDVTMVVNPGDDPKSVQARWLAQFEAASKAYRESPEYLERQKREAEELQRKKSAVMVETAQSEAEMRAAPSVWPYTQKQLNEYINSLVDRPHEYGTCVYAMALAAVAAFYYVSHQLGVTGFQASCADLEFLRRTRSLEGPFMIIDGSNALYPQYDLESKLRDALEEWKPWLKHEAKKKLAENSHVHPAVLAHWKKLAGIK